MIEVELKAKVNDEKELEEKILKTGGKFLKRYKEVDEYFSPIHRDFWKTIECLRLRKRNNSKYGILTYKPPSTSKTQKAGVFNKKEIELKVDYQKIKQIFKYLNMKQLITVKKDRKIYQLNDFEITIDTLPKLGVFTEISIMLPEGASLSDVDNARKKIINLLHKLKINYEIVTLPYRHLYLKQKKNN